MIRGRGLSSLAALALSGAAAGPVWPQAGEDLFDLPLEELERTIVTARFREEPLQETPLAMTVFTGEALEGRRLSDVTHLDAFSPNTVLQPLGAGWGSTLAAFIRGVGLDDNALSFEPGVPIYIDNVYHGRPQGAILDLLDLERVEVLRGPQGTLFGKNAIGGTIRLVSRAPNEGSPSYVELTTGSFDRFDLRGAIETALLEETLYARLAASAKRRDGYFDILDYACIHGRESLSGGGPGIPADSGPALPAIPPMNLGSQPAQQAVGTGCKVDTLGDENVQTGRLTLRWLPNDRLDIVLAGDATRIDQKGPSDKQTFLNPEHPLVQAWNENVALPVFGVPYDTRFLTASNFTGYHRFGIDPLTRRDLPNTNSLKHWGVSATIDWSLSTQTTLTSITAYREFENSFGRDSDGSPLPVIHTWDTTDHEQFTQELQLVGLSLDDRLEWVTGFFLYDARDTNWGWNLLFPFVQSNFDHRDVQNTRSWAAFGHGSYRLNPRLSLSGGLRYTHDRKDVNVFRQDFVTGETFVPDIPLDLQAKEYSPKIGLNFQVNPRLMAYVQWSTGFRGGGFSPRPQNASQVRSFGIERLETLEGGVKTIINDKLSMNAAVFLSRYKDQQQAALDVDAFGDLWFRYINTGRSEYRGAELELLASPIETFRVDASLGYTRFDRVDPGRSGLCRFDTRGDLCPSPRTPEWTAALGMTYDWRMGDLGLLKLRAEAIYQSKTAFHEAPPFGFQQDLLLVNSQLHWTSSDEAWTVSLFGSNLSDEEYFHGKLSLVSAVGKEQGNIAAPREWGLSVKRQFP